jgi:hypothetical protein
MGLNLPRLRRSLRRVLAGRYVSFEAAAVQAWTLCPAARTTIQPALHPEGALDLIRTVSPYRKADTEHALIRGGEFPIGATRRYLHRHVSVVDSHLYCGAAESCEGTLPERWWLAPAPPEPELAEATLVSTLSGAEFFGCLLLDDFALELLADEGATRICLPGLKSRHEPDYRRLMGLAPRHELRRSRIRELTYLVDPPFNAAKSARYATLRQRLRQNLPGASPAGSGLLYIRRGLAGQRRVISNEPALEAALQARGFSIIDPMAMGAEAVARQSLDARLVVSIEGSQISHAIFSMADGGALLVLQPPDRFCLQYKEFTDAMGMRFGFVVGRPAEDGFMVDVGEVLGMVDRLA